MNNIIAIIPARSGSKSVLDKNIKDLNGYPVLAYSIAAAKLTKKINRVIVSTDSDHYAKIAKNYGAEVPFLRPKQFSGDKSTDRDFFLHAIDWFKNNESEVPKTWVHLRPTTPLRLPKIIDDAINCFLNNPQASSLRSAHMATESPIKWFIKEKKYFKSFVDVELSNLPKEIFRETFIPNGYVDILRTSEFLNNENIHGENIFGYISPTVSEIDSMEEFEYITYQLQKKGSLLLDYLNRVNNKNGR